MNKFRRYLPLFILLLVLAFYLLPTQNTAVAPVSESANISSSDSLNLIDPVQESSFQSETSPSVSNADSPQLPSSGDVVDMDDALLPEDGSYTTKEDVSLYLVQYGHLPSNFITKAEAKKAGWSGGSLEKVLPGMCIGGDYFGNYEGLLPKAKGRTWSECDINTLGSKSRGAERLIFSNDGMIYYTDDHYESFTRLY